MALLMFSRLRPILHPAVHLGQGNVNVAIVGVTLEQGFHMLDGHIGLAHVGLLRGRNHLQAAVIGIFLGQLRPQHRLPSATAYCRGKFQQFAGSREWRFHRQGPSRGQRGGLFHYRQPALCFPVHVAAARKYDVGKHPLRR